MEELTSRRIILLGKTGAGKSSLANTIFAEDLFKINHFPISDTSQSHAETKYVDGKRLTLIDSHSFFDTCGSETLLRNEVVRCITECVPGPHAFLIVLKAEKFTMQEQDVIKEICHYFSEDALKRALIVFTHGEQLPEGIKIEEFVKENKALSDLVRNCGSRCHVVDNKYWRDKDANNYRSNRFQIGEILMTIDKIIETNQGNYYTNDMLAAVKREIQREEESIAQSAGTKSQEQIRNEARKSVFGTLVIRLAGVATGVLLGAFLGLVGNVQELPELSTLVTSQIARAGVASAALRGGVDGFWRGFNATGGAETLGEAMQRAAEAVRNQNAFQVLDQSKDY